jgi:hypothetical protein
MDLSADLSSERWESIAPSELEATARRLAKQLPSGFCFEAIGRFGFGERQRHVALYRQNDATFALIPAATVLLGYDADRPWEPCPDELESWQGTSKEYGIDKTVQEYIAAVTMRIRRAELPPFLIETTAAEVAWEPVGMDDPGITDILREYGTHHGKLYTYRGNTRIQIHRDPGGAPVVERSVSCTHAELAARLAAEGFRFPTPDEWEYACGAGAPTLFRWGDHVPCDRCPIDISPAEAEWRKQSVLSHGKLEYPAEGFTPDWDRHRQPNAFGLSIASNPYHYELTSEIGLTRGGDGGSMIHGGVGNFVEWLTLATAYFEKHSCRHKPKERISAGYTIGRRVLELG